MSFICKLWNKTDTTWNTADWTWSECQFVQDLAQELNEGGGARNPYEDVEPYFPWQKSEEKKRKLMSPRR